MKTATQNMLLA